MPSRVRIFSAIPTWSKCAWVSTTASICSSRWPSVRIAASSGSQAVGTPASTSVSESPSSTRKKFVWACSIWWTPSATLGWRGMLKGFPILASDMAHLVTGALGAIGAWTVRSLLDRGQDVVTYDLGGSDHRLRLALSDEQLAALTRVEGDVTDLAQLERVIDDHDVDAIIHLAALQVP